MREAGQEARLRYYLRRYAEAFDEVLFFSYAREQFDLSDIHRAVRIVPRKLPLDGSVYSMAMPLVAHSEMASCDVLRVLQMSAAASAALAKAFYGLPYVATFGYDLPTLARRRGWIHGKWAAVNIWLACRNADAIIYGTPFLYELLQTYRPRGELIHIPNGVDLTLFEPTKIRTSPAGPWRIMSVGRLSSEKNYRTLIEALRGMKGVELHLIGSGPERSELERLADRIGVPLRLHGTLRQTELPSVLAAADVFVLPSLTEGHPKALLEAMACGVPCLGAKEAPGIRALIEDGVNGVLSEGNVPGLRAAVERLLSDRGHAASMAGEARVRIERDYDLDALVSSEIRTLRRFARARRDGVD
jgi:glycosyltransferase involved in cell wall biosynthesis